MQTFNCYTHSDASISIRRAARACDGKSIDKLHALALHQYRCTHKTKSQLISLIHLVSVYGTHPELREWLQSTQSAVMVRVAAYLDRLLEMRNDIQKSRNTSRKHILNSLHFTPVQPALQHVQSTWRTSQVSAHACEGITGVRASMINEVQAIVRLFVEKIGPDMVTPTTKSLLWHTGNPHEMMAGSVSIKESLPWEYVQRVATARSVGEGCGKAKWWHDAFRKLVQESLFWM